MTDFTHLFPVLSINSVFGNGFPPLYTLLGITACFPREWLLGRL